jgi:hypothetical protein
VKERAYDHHRPEGRHRNAIAKADTAMRRSIEATRDAERARGKAEAASHTTDRRYRPVTVANRIETLNAEIRKLERRIAERRYDAERGYVAATAEQIDAARARLTPTKSATRSPTGKASAQRRSSPAPPPVTAARPSRRATA